MTLPKDKLNERTSDSDDAKGYHKKHVFANDIIMTDKILFVIAYFSFQESYLWTREILLNWKLNRLLIPEESGLIWIFSNLFTLQF